VFSSLKAAADFYKVNPNSVKKWPKTNYKQAFFLEETTESTSSED
jgi:hypothetical protein